MTCPSGSNQIDSSEQWGDIERSEERCLELSLPARPELWSLVRMAVGSVASTIGYDLETIADLRLALDELCNECAVGATSSSVLHVTCHWNEVGLYVSCSVSFISSSDGSGDRSEDQTPADGDLPAGLSQRELSESILTALVDAYGISTIEQDARRGWLRTST